MMYTVETISELFLQLSHAAPFLTTQWLYILILLHWCPQDFWASVLSPGFSGEEEEEQQETEKASPSQGLHREIVRRAGLVLYCDFLCDHTSNVEGTTWLVVNHVREVVRNATESPVQDFVMSMHGSASSSSLLLQAVVTCCGQRSRMGEREGSHVVFLRQALQVRELLWNF